jgi:branched-chain amino acid aminotransferase
MSEPRPSIAWLDGRIVPWKDAVVPLWSEAVLRGSSIFEGIRAYWQPEERRFNIVRLDDHLDRLAKSARLEQLPLPAHLIGDLRAGILHVLAAQEFREHMYVRPTVLILTGRYTDDPGQLELSSFVPALPVPSHDQLSEATACVSSWRRDADGVTMPRSKLGAAYHALRRPLIEARARGAQDAILLNATGLVVEATASSVFLVARDTVITPPLSDGLLDSITRRCLIELCRTSLGWAVVERSVDRSELYLAEEVFTCSTLSELVSVTEIDGMPVGDGRAGPISTELHRGYRDICLGSKQPPTPWLTFCRV